MEVLNVLEQKIAGLIELIKELRLENAQLKDQVEKLQASLLERPQEIALTKSEVDALIENIDFLISREQEQ